MRRRLTTGPALQDSIRAALREHPRRGLPEHHRREGHAPDVCGTCWDSTRPGFAVWPCPTVAALDPFAELTP